MRIVAEKLNAFYSEKTKFAVHALKEVSITIEEGEFYGIIGHTGSGKSTFVQHLNGLIKVGKKKGSLKIGEFDLTNKKCDFKSLRSKVGMVFQYPEYQLFAETVEKDVAFGYKNFFPKATEEEIKRAVKYALETCGLDYNAVKDKSPFDLSGGQKRRVAIAGVIVTKPEILVLDEPASGLDPQGKKELFELIRNLKNTFVKTVVLVSHDMDAVMENCTRVAIFDKGSVVKEGLPNEVFKDIEYLKGLGLDAPMTALCLKELQQKGIEIDSEFTVQAFIDSVERAYKTKGGAL